MVWGGGGGSEAFFGVKKGFFGVGWGEGWREGGSGVFWGDLRYFEEFCFEGKR